MRPPKIPPFFALFLIFSALPMFGQLWSGVLDPSRAVDWSRVGVAGGIPSGSWTQCGATIAPYSGSAGTINNAIAACPANHYVLLGAGTFKLSSGITWGSNGQSNVALRGAGADQTLLVFTGSDPCTGQSSDICIQSADTSYWGGPSNTASWTAAYARGTTSITLSNSSNLSVGSPLILDQLDDASDNGTIYICQTDAGKCAHDGPAGSSRSGRGQMQLVTVTSCSPSCNSSGATTVGINPGLYMPNWRSSQSPGAWWANTPVSSNGVENLSIDNSSSSAMSGVMLFNCLGCWVKGVRSLNPSRSHVWFWTSPRGTVRDSYFYGTQSAAQESYGVETFGSSDTLIENNIFQRIAAPVLFNSDCPGCVVGYNYSVNNYYSQSSSWQQQSIFFHSITDYILLEGNVGVGLYADLFHGTHYFNTLFRNSFDGFESNNGTTTSSHTNPILLYPLTRYTNIVGNVLGSTRRPHNTYQNTPSSSPNSDQAVYIVGTGASAVNYPDDPQTLNSLMRWGNYDVVNNAVRWVSSEVPSGITPYANPVPSSQTLPASFYLSSKPSWWPSGKAWPPIGPDVAGGTLNGSGGSMAWATQAIGGHANNIPAMDCYKNTMSGPADGTGAVLSFNAAACYSSSAGSGGTVNPPSGLTAVPH